MHCSAPHGSGGGYSEIGKGGPTDGGTEYPSNPNGHDCALITSGCGFCACIGCSQGLDMSEFDGMSGSCHSFRCRPWVMVDCGKGHSLLGGALDTSGGGGLGDRLCRLGLELEYRLASFRTLVTLPRENPNLPPIFRRLRSGWLFL